ncbi:MAG: phage tail sheath C-terminal domain-containing protein [Trebonia sp.]
MPVTPTYPGVYVEELASQSHTIVGVATSITAFVGYTKQGPANQATEVLSWGDFTRAFGQLDSDCPLTYAVQQFFLNGGSDAFIVRVAEGATRAGADLVYAVGKQVVLSLQASSAGIWGNTLQVTIDRNTINPLSFFNLSVTQYVASGGSLVAGPSEAYRNLTLNSTAPTYAVDTINFNSKLLSATRGSYLPTTPTALPGGPQGTSTSGTLSTVPAITPTANSIVLSVDGSAPTVLTLGAVTTLTQIKNQIVSAATSAGLAITGSVSGSTLVFKSASTTEQSSVRFTAAPTNDAAALLMLGVAAGGAEVDAIATYHPMPTGTTGKDIDVSLAAGTAPYTTIASFSGANHFVLATFTIDTVAQTVVSVPLTTTNTQIATKEDMRALLQASLQAAALTYSAVAAELAGASVAIVNNCYVVSAGGPADAEIQIADDTTNDTVKTATAIGFDGTPVPNLAAYSPATPSTLMPLAGQNTAILGADGSAPLNPSTIIGDQGSKTGIYALENVDLFNLLVLPDTLSTDTPTVMSTAMTYCENRRAVLIVDLPTSTTSLSQAQTWIAAPATPKSANAAAYFPRALFADPNQNYRPRPMPTAGAIAGLYARTDASRGVWKAPAGTNATITGVSSMQVPLTDMENGTINPLGLNANRGLPVYGFVVWGARTLVGADVMTSQWKYVPVRRTALYIEESLFRGTKWVVFEPNDEPLWAAIRMNVGAFMQSLFIQGAFQGSSPRQAYLVKCDSETTTQDDIDQGIVNILVGFAPLKPAEFVVIQITQLTGQPDS